MEKEPTFSPEQKREKEMKTHEECIMNIIKEAQAFMPEEIEKLEEFVNDSSTREQFPPEELEEMTAKDEEMGATNRVLIAARAWLDNRK